MTYKKKQILRFIFGVLFIVLSFVTLIAPFYWWLDKNIERYVVYGVDKIGIGAMITIIYAGALIKGAFKEIDRKLNTLIFMGIFLAVTWFLQSIINDLFWIILCGIIGYASWMIFYKIGRRMLKTYGIGREEKIRVEARQDEEVVYNGRG